MTPYESIQSGLSLHVASPTACQEWHWFARSISQRGAMGKATNNITFTFTTRGRACVWLICFFVRAELIPTAISLAKVWRVFIAVLACRADKSHVVLAACHAKRTHKTSVNNTTSSSQNQNKRYQDHKSHIRRGTPRRHPQSHRGRQKDICI